MVVVIASRNGAKSVQAAMSILRTGGSALDAVEQRVKVIEDDSRNTSVG